MALTAVLRRFRVPAVALSLFLFLGLFLLTASDAGAYPRPLPAWQAEQHPDGDPDEPLPFHGDKAPGDETVLDVAKLVFKLALEVSLVF